MMKPPPVPAPEPVTPAAPAEPPAKNALTGDQPSFLRLPNNKPESTPVRVGVILPFNSTLPGVRGLANSLMKAAELALFDSKNHDILLMTADEGSGGAQAGAAATQLLNQGAEVIIGPLFGPSVAAVAPLARDKGVPVLAFSTEKSVAGNGVYLISFLPQNEVRRVVSYAAEHGHSEFAALLPQTAYGDVVGKAFDAAVKDAKGHLIATEKFPNNAGAVAGPTGIIAKTSADAILIAQGGVMLRAIAPTLTFDGVDKTKVKFLGTGLWADPAMLKERSLDGGWFAAPEPNADAAFEDKYRSSFGATPPALASLAYDAVSLVALLSSGKPYHRFTKAALMDPNGFAGVNGIFRFDAEGAAERGLAVLEVEPAGFTVVSPAPKTFEKHESVDKPGDKPAG